MTERPSLIAAIQQALRDGLVSRDHVLREDDPKSTSTPITIHRAGKSVFLSFNAKVPFSANGDPVCIKDRLFPLFQERQGIARMCDYWIFCERGGDEPVLYVLLCELKSKNPDGLAQIENGKLLAEYFLRMVGHHHKLDVTRVELRGIVFTGAARAPKQGLRPSPIKYQSIGRLGIPVAYLSDRVAYHLAALCG